MEKIRIRTLPCGNVRMKRSMSFLDDRSLFESRQILPNNVFLLEHPQHGRILFDTGWSSDCRKTLPRRLLDLYDPEIRPGETAAEQLASLGIRPEDIDLLLLTHLDADHTSALKDFAGKAKRIACAELEYFYSCRTVYKRREFWESWIPYADRIERIHYRASVLGPAGRGFDLFGDESPSNRFLVHGDGRYGGAFSVIASDTAFSQRNLDEEVVPGYGFDRRMQLKSLLFLKSLQDDPMHRFTLFCHASPEQALLEL